MWNWARRILPELNRKTETREIEQDEGWQREWELCIKKDCGMFQGKSVLYIACITSDAPNHNQREKQRQKCRYRSQHTDWEPKSCNSKTTVRFFLMCFVLFRDCVSHVIQHEFFICSQSALIHFSSSSLLLLMMSMLYFSSLLIQRCASF